MNFRRRGLLKVATGLARLSLVEGTSGARLPSGAAAAYGSAIRDLLSRWDVPGASIAVAKEGRIVHAAGYGWADRDGGRAVTDQMTFRMGSVNKTLTSVAILNLVEEGHLTLDAPALPLLGDLHVEPNRIVDERMTAITVRDLLQHSAGFDRSVSGDPFFGKRLHEVARRQNEAPVSARAIAVDALTSKLDFEPGSRHAYSNVGYCLLGFIVEAASGTSFRNYVSKKILLPTIGKPYRLGASLRSDPDEVTYYPDEPTRGLTAPGLPLSLLGMPSAYGTYHTENMEALGGWVARPADVLTFFMAIDGHAGSALLKASSIAQMLERPRFVPGSAQHYYGLGVNVRIVSNGRRNWWHGGSQPGVRTLALRSAQGLSWVAAFNGGPRDNKGAPGSFVRDFDRTLWRVAQAVL